MKLPRLLLLLSLVIHGLGLIQSSRACLNDYGPNVVVIERSHSLLAQLTEHPTAEPWPARRDRLRKLLAAGGDFRVKNDLATALVHTGEAAEAVSLFEQIEAEKPGLYFTAANLGTAYELTGDNRRAVEWIRKGIERNPNAHDGTEWLHVRILEAKLAIGNDSAWLEKHSVIDGQSPEQRSPIKFSALGNLSEPLSANQVKAALIHQLHERLQFVSPPEPIVGSLLLDLGDLISTEKLGEGGAADIVALAQKYLEGLPKEHPLTFRATVAGVHSYWGQRLSRDPGPSLTIYDYIFWAGVLLVIGWVVWRFLFRKCIRKFAEYRSSRVKSAT